MLKIIEETSKALRSGPIEMRRAAEVAENYPHIQHSNNCPYCGAYWHSAICPRVEEIEYYPDGLIKRVKLRLIEDK